MFSYELVFSPNNETISINKTTIIKKIYEVLNKHLFRSSLKMPRLVITNKYSSTNIAGYNYRYILYKGDSKLTLVKETITMPNGEKLLPPQILFNESICNDINLIFFVNVLAHEMIHQDDIENGSLLDRIYQARILKKTIDSHDGFFSDFANKVNLKFNLNITSKGKTMQFEIDKSIEAIRRELHENERLKLTNEKIEDNISDIEKLRRCKSNLICNDEEMTEYLGYGVFDSTLF